MATHPLIVVNELAASRDPGRSLGLGGAHLRRRRVLGEAGHDVVVLLAPPGLCLGASLSDALGSRGHQAVQDRRDDGHEDGRTEGDQHRVPEDGQRAEDGGHCHDDECHHEGDDRHGPQRRTALDRASDGQRVGRSRGGLVHVGTHADELVLDVVEAGLGPVALRLAPLPGRQDDLVTLDRLGELDEFGPGLGDRLLGLVLLGLGHRHLLRGRVGLCLLDGLVGLLDGLGRLVGGLGRLGRAVGLGGLDVLVLVRDEYLELLAEYAQAGVDAVLDVRGDGLGVAVANHVSELGDLSGELLLALLALAHDGLLSVVRSIVETYERSLSSSYIAAIITRGI